MNLPMGWDVRFSQGILQSYKPPNWMGCKILPGNLTILQTSPWDVRWQSYNLANCMQTILQPGCRHGCFEVPWLSEMLVGTPRDRLDLKRTCSIAFFKSFRALALAASSLTSRFRPCCWVSHFLYFGVPLGGTPMARAKRKQGVCTQDAWAYGWLRRKL